MPPLQRPPPLEAALRAREKGRHRRRAVATLAAGAGVPELSAAAASFFFLPNQPPFFFFVPISVSIGVPGNGRPRGPADGRAVHEPLDERGLDEAALLHLDGNVRVRLGYLLVLHGELNEAESTLGPLLRHALTNTTGSSEHGLFTGPNVEKRALLQEAATYVGWSRAFRRDWTGASDAHAVGAAFFVPTHVF